MEKIRIYAAEGDKAADTSSVILRIESEFGPAELTLPLGGYPKDFEENSAGYRRVFAEVSRALSEVVESPPTLSLGRPSGS